MLLLAVAGIGLVVVACVTTGAEIERALVSDATRTLSWGTTLFRLLLAAHGCALFFVAVSMVRRSEQPSGALQPGSFHNTPTDKRTMRRATWLMWLVLISVVAFALRVWRLDADLWTDEVFTLVDFVRLPFGEILTRFPNQNQHMLFSLLASGAVGVFGESAWAVRVPSVMFGVASVWMLFLFGRRVMDERAALIAAALMSVSYHHVWFSQNARGYMGLLFFTLAASWLWMEMLRRGAWAWYVAYGFAAALGSWIHLTMVFVVVAQFVLYCAVLVVRARQASVDENLKGDIWRGLAAWTLAATLTLQLYALALPEFLHTGLHEESLPSEWTSVWWIVQESLRNLRFGFAGTFAILIGAGVTLLGLVSIWRRDRVAALAMTLPIALAGAVMFALGHNLWPRFFFFGMGYGLLIVIAGVIEVPHLLSRVVLRERLGSERARARVGYALACGLIAISILTLPRNYRLPKQDFSGARDWIERARRPNENIVAVGLAGAMYGRYFAPRWIEAQTGAELERIERDAAAGVWLVYTLPIEVRVYRPDVWRIVERDFAVVRVFPGTLGGGEIYVCQTRATRSDASEDQARR